MASVDKWFPHSSDMSVAQIGRIPLYHFGVDTNESMLKDKLKSGLNLTLNLLEPSVGMSLHKNKLSQINQGLEVLTLTAVGGGLEYFAYEIYSHYGQAQVTFPDVPIWPILSALGLIPFGTAVYKATNIPREIFSSQYQYDPINKDFRLQPSKADLPSLHSSYNREPIALDAFKQLTADLIRLVPRD